MRRELGKQPALGELLVFPYHLDWGEKSMIGIQGKDRWVWSMRLDSRPSPMGEYTRCGVYGEDGEQRGRWQMKEAPVRLEREYPLTEFLANMEQIDLRMYREEPIYSRHSTKAKSESVLGAVPAPLRPLFLIESLLPEA